MSINRADAIGQKWGRRVALIATVQLALAQIARAESTNAVIPYKQLDQVCHVAQGVNQSNLVFKVLLFSSKTNVEPSDISLTIQSASNGKILLKLGPDGEVLNFPHDDKLLRENPSIIANQPKGTLKMIVTMQLPLPNELTFRYARLGDGVAEITKVIKEQAGMMSFLAPKAEGVMFMFPKDRAVKAKVSVLSSTGKKEYIADTHGQIKLKLEKSLLKENPEVQLSEMPQGIVPDIQ